MYGNMYEYVLRKYVFVINGCRSVSACVFIYSSNVSAYVLEYVKILFYLILFYFMIYSMAFSVGKRLCVRY